MSSFLFKRSGSLTPIIGSVSTWGKVLEQLRMRKNISQGELARKMIIGKDEYYRLCRSKRGPTIATLDALLQGMGCTWHDWAIAYETTINDSTV